MDAKILPGNRGGYILVVNGNRYQKHRKNKDDTINWRCWRKLCRSRVKTNRFALDNANANIQVLFHEEHNHEPDEVIVQRAELRKTMQDMVTNDPACPVKRVYNAAVSQLHRRAQGGGDRPNVDQFYSFRSILNRTKASQMPAIPHSIDDVVIEGTWAETWLNDRYLLHRDNDWGITIFATDENIKSLQQCQELYMDATFRCCPAPYTQFFTILGKYRGWVIPLVMVLMENRQVGHYRQVLSAIAREVRQITHHRWRPRIVICDFEQALLIAVETELPHVQIGGCYFHFTQALWRQIQELGLARRYRNSRSLKKCLRKVMALGYLPLALVQMNFNMLRTSRRTNNLVNRFPSLMDFFAYFRNTYIHGMFPTALWNVYERNMDLRTNNNVESKYAYCKV